MVFPLVDKITKNKYGISWSIPILFYGTVIIAELWRFIAYYSPAFERMDCRKWWLSYLIFREDGYRIPDNQSMDFYVWIKCLSNEMCYVSLALAFVISLKIIYSKVYPITIDAKRSFFFILSVAWSILIWTITSLSLHVWNYNRDGLLALEGYLIVEGAFCILRYRYGKQHKLW